MAQITIKFTKEEFKAIDREAEKQHLKRATYCRKIILDNLPDQLPRDSFTRY